jgi:Tol biopolymer transport system component
MARRTVLLPALLVVALLLAWAAVLLAVSKEAEATFPGQNGRIAYESRDGHDLEIYTVNARAGGNRTRVTNNDTEDAAPILSPDGKRIAYIHHYGGTDQELYTSNIDGGDVVQVTNNATDESFPCYSPDGKRIVYINHDGTGTDIYSINVGG